MKEYEFIVQAIENDLCDQLTGVICRENYEVKPFSAGFRRIFDEYGRLHNEYAICSESERNTLVESYQKVWKNKCQERIEEFISDLREEQNAPDVEGLKNTFFNALSKEDVKTTEKKTFIYPYLVTKMRECNSSRRKKKNDN